MQIKTKKIKNKLSLFLSNLLLFNLIIVSGTTTFASIRSNTKVCYSVTGNTMVGSIIDIAINISNINNLYGASVDFLYNPSLIEIQSITKGNIFERNNPITPLGAQGQIKKDANGKQIGQASFVVTLQGNKPGVSNNGSIAIIKAKVLKEGSIKLNSTNSNSSLNLNGNTVRIKLSNSNATSINYQKTNHEISLTNNNLAISNINTNKSSPQGVNSTIRISPKATGNGTLTYKFWIHDGSSWSIPQDFSTKDYYDWTPTKAGTYRLWVDVKDSSGKMVSKEIKYVVTNNNLAISNINTNKSSPQGVNSTIRISPKATGNGTLTYKFWIHDGSSWSIPQDFSTKDYYDWTPTKAGTYRLWVDVKDSSGKMVSKEIKYVVTNNNLAISNINTNKSSPQGVNSTIRISPKATGNGTLTYKFWIHNGSSWSIPQDFSTKDYYDWTPTKAGTYRLWVDVKDSSGKMVSKEIKYVVTNNNLAISNINTNKSSPQGVNSTIRISPKATGNGTLTYKFWIHNGSSWSIPQDFSTKDYYDWTPTKAGTYRLWVDVKDSSGKMVSKEIKYVVTNNNLAISNINTNKSSPQGVNSTIRISPKATGNGTLTYKFWIHNGSSWSIPQDFSTKDYYDWTPTKAGTYRLWVDVKDSSGKMVSKEIKYVVTNNNLAISNINTNKSSPQGVNSTIRISPKATGNGTLTYKFWIHNGSSWSIPQDFSTKDYYDWTPTKAGTYRLWVDVKDSSGKMVSKEIKYVVTNNNLAISNINTNKSSPQGVNSTIRISPKATGNGTLTYKFWIHDGSSWSIPQDFSTKDYYDWTPTKAGTYRLWVDVKDSSGKMVSKEIKYVVTNNNLAISNISTNKSSPQGVNSTIRISPKATGNGTLTYKFWIHDGSSWSIPQDFSTKDYYDWTPTKAGTYRLWVDVKDSSGKMVSKEIKYVVK